jgi:hypothetical protein
MAWSLTLQGLAGNTQTKLPPMIATVSLALGSRMAKAGQDDGGI